MIEAQRIVHPIPPLFDQNSKKLILGSFPSIKSREAMFFYGHPQNRFWRLIAMIYGEDAPLSTEEKSKLILKHNLALWDSIKTCTITGSADSSVKDVVPNDLSVILNGSRVTEIYCNGALSYNLYMKYSFPTTGIAAQKLPSTSPANAAYSIERLYESWKIIKE